MTAQVSSYAQAAWTKSVAAAHKAVNTATPYASKLANGALNLGQRTWVVTKECSQIAATKGYEGLRIAGNTLVKTAQIAAQWLSQFAQITIEFCKNNTRDLSFVALGALACGAILYIASRVFGKKPAEHVPPVVIIADAVPVNA